MQAPLTIQFKLLTWQPKTVLLLWWLKMTANMITTSLKLLAVQSFPFKKTLFILVFIPKDRLFFLKISF